MPLAHSSFHVIPNKAARALGLLAWGLLLAGCSAKAPNATPGAAGGAGAAGSSEQLGAGAGEPNPQPPVEVTLALNWFPESEHGGYYAAQVRRLLPPGGARREDSIGWPGARMLEQVAAGRATFGIANADNILFARAGQMPVVALLAPLQSSPRCIMVHKATGIDTFDKLRDVTLAMTPGAAFADFLRWKLPLPGVRVVPYTGSVQPFLVDPRYAQQGYIFSEPFLRSKGGRSRRAAGLGAGLQSLHQSAIHDHRNDRSTSGHGSPHGHGQRGRLAGLSGRPRADQSPHPRIESGGRHGSAGFRRPRDHSSDRHGRGPRARPGDDDPGALASAGWAACRIGATVRREGRRERGL